MVQMKTKCEEKQSYSGKVVHIVTTVFKWVILSGILLSYDFYPYSLLPLCRNVLCESHNVQNCKFYFSYSCRSVGQSASHSQDMHRGQSQ
jgi:hypothetical protein